MYETILIILSVFVTRIHNFKCSENEDVARTIAKSQNITKTCILNFSKIPLIPTNTGTDIFDKDHFKF